jgi:hypothetical protein
VSDRLLRVVLDTTAVIAFGNGSDHVGEVIRELVDEGVDFGVPVLCLVDAAGNVKDERWHVLQLLASHPHCALLPLLSTDWRAVAAATRLLGDAGRATAALPVARDEAHYVMTADPGEYSGLPTIAI